MSETVLLDQLKGASTLLVLEQRLRAATSLQNLGFIFVNEVASLIPHETALIWLADDWDKTGLPLSGKLTAASNTTNLDPRAPMMEWVGRLVSGHKPREILELSSGSDTDWFSEAPSNLVLVPLSCAGGKIEGYAVFLTNESLGEAQTNLLIRLGDAAGHAAELLRLRRKRPSFSGHFSRQRKRWALALVILMIGLIPVPSRLLAPATVVAVDPLLIRSSIDGVVAEVLVDPNEHVEAGQQLIKIDDRALKSELETARRDAEIADAEYRQASQAATRSLEARQQLQVLKVRAEQKQQKLQYVEDYLNRTVIVADEAGTAVFTDQDRLLGVSIRLGERLMSIADPSAVELSIDLPVGEDIPLDANTQIVLFPDSDPLSSYDAVLQYQAYEAHVNDAGQLVFRLEARFAEDQQLPRLGAKGTARIEGPLVPLAYMLFRRPFAIARQALGL